MSVSINLQIEGGESIGPGLLRFDPGSTLRCNAQLLPQQDIKARNTTLWVQWHTEGRGDKDTGKGNPIVIAEGNLQNGVPIYQTYDLVLPNQPWSYSGHYIKIIWSVQVKVDIPRAKDYTAGVQFVMLPPNSGTPVQQPAGDGFASDNPSNDPLNEIGDFGFGQ